MDSLAILPCFLVFFSGFCYQVPSKKCPGMCPKMGFMGFGVVSTGFWFTWCFFGVFLGFLVGFLGFLMFWGHFSLVR